MSAPATNAADSDVRLPTHQRVSHYDLALVPDLTAFTFAGQVNIKLQLLQESQTVQLDSLECTFPNGADGKPLVSLTPADVQSGNQSIPCQSVTLNEKSERVTFDFGDKIAAGFYVLAIRYDGILNAELAGFYRSSYKGAKGETKYMAVTQFEATDCRRALPSVDEPAAKATFDVTLIVESHLTAVSNMPVLDKTTTSASDSEEEKKKNRGLTYAAGMNRYRFYTSPVMSTYLLAFIVGEFDYISATSASGVEIRVFTGLGKSALGRFSLDVAVKALEFYNNYFGIKYPLPKMDLLAIPDFAAGAMENWGAITYRETALLIDPVNSSTAVLQRVCRTVCHEIAHMWFGNLVTMEWWSFLWLNEGFARFMEHLATDHIFPDWKIWDSFVAEVYAQAQNLDALESSHPVEVTVHHASEVNQIFDTISYAKGASIIRMLNAAIGQEAFQKGLSAYLKKYSYQNTLSKDLWECFAESSGQDVANMMAVWTQKIGYPVVKVSTAEGNPKRICMCQERFLGSYNPNDKQKLTETTWTIPVEIARWHASADSKHTNEIKPVATQRVNFNQPEQQVDLGASVLSDDPKHVWKLNPHCTGFYRTQYSPDLLSKLAPSIPFLPPLERLSLLRDSFALSSSGRITIKQSLDLLQYYSREDSYAVVSALTGNLYALSSLHSDSNEYYPQLQKLVRNTFKFSCERLGWEPSSAQSQYPETDLTALFRALILHIQGTVAEDPAIIDEALKRFRASRTASVGLPADLRGLVYNIVAKKGTPEDREQLFEMYAAAELQEEKNRILGCLGLVSSGASNEVAEKQIDRALAMLVSDQVRPGNVGFLMSSIGQSRLGRVKAWAWFQNNFPVIQEKFMKGQNFIIAALLNGMLGGWNEVSILEQTGPFFKEHPIPQANRTLQQLTEAITNKAQRFARENKEIAEWLKANPQ